MKTVIDLYADLPYLTRFVKGTLPPAEHDYVVRILEKDDWLKDIVDCIKMDLGNEENLSSFAEFAEETRQDLWPTLEAEIENSKKLERMKQMDTFKRASKMLILVMFSIVLFAIYPAKRKFNKPLIQGIPSNKEQPLDPIKYALDWTTKQKNERNRYYSNLKPSLSESNKHHNTEATTNSFNKAVAVSSITEPNQNIILVSQESLYIFSASVPDYIISTDKSINELYRKLDSLQVLVINKGREKDTIMKDIELAMYFTRTNQSFAINATMETNIPAVKVLLRALKESDLGLNSTAKSCHNYFNLMIDENNNVIEKNSSGVIYGTFKHYANLQASFKDYVSVFLHLMSQKGINPNSSNIEVHFDSFADDVAYNKSPSPIFAMLDGN